MLLLDDGSLEDRRVDGSGQAAGNVRAELAGEVQQAGEDRAVIGILSSAGLSASVDTTGGRSASAAYSRRRRCDDYDRLAAQ
ncbi:MAG: hypothetical protein QM682_15690 [Paracoccus sp. (in: a-proteobacteria)]|uniref:hypothetical protein n=1 Tax=Paracoccus sp. TaxID=267 RepID=UPI0039E2ED37